MLMIGKSIVPKHGHGTNADFRARQMGKRLAKTYPEHDLCAVRGTYCTDTVAEWVACWPLKTRLMATRKLWVLA